MNRGDERYERTKYALERMGSAVLGSALTTLGCAAFLLPCTIVIFTKIGAVVLAVTFYAICYTMLPLPAVLMVMGPCRKDLAQIVEFIWKTMVWSKKWWMGEDLDDDHAGSASARRYILNMPARCMSDNGQIAQASRTKIIATG